MTDDTQYDMGLVYELHQALKTRGYEVRNWGRFAGAVHELVQCCRKAEHSTPATTTASRREKPNAATGK